MPEPVMSFDLDEGDWLTLCQEVPVILNSETQKAFRAVGAHFMRGFTRARLGGRPGIKVKRATSRKVTRAVGEGAIEKTPNRRRLGPTSVTIPKKARQMGFKGKVAPAKELSGKLLEVRSGSPVTAAHEFGRPIRPKKPGGYLYIPIRSAAAARRAGVKLPTRRRAKRGPRKGQPLAQPTVIRVKVIKPVARLGFRKAWKAYRSPALQRVQQGLTRTVERAELKAKRRRERAARRRTG